VRHLAAKELILDRRDEFRGADAVYRQRAPPIPDSAPLTRAASASGAMPAMRRGSNPEAVGVWPSGLKPLPSRRDLQSRGSGALQGVQITFAAVVRFDQFPGHGAIEGGKLGGWESLIRLCHHFGERGGKQADRLRIITQE
jgi:hypothetical protein